MDPNAAWKLLAQAVQAEDWRAAEEHALDLQEWINRGGAPPTITGFPAFDRTVAVNTCTSILNWELP